MKDGLKILLIVIAALLVIAAVAAVLLLTGPGATYETVDEAFRPAEKPDLHSEVALTPAEETPAPTPQPDPAFDPEAGPGEPFAEPEDAPAEDAEAAPAENAESTEEGETTPEKDADGFYPVSDTVTVTGDSVNVRSQPNTNCEILGSLNRGQTLSRTGYNDDNWVRINYSGKTAYVSGDYVK